MTPPNDVIAAAQAAQRKWGVPACISIAQWALESGWGAHMPIGSNNPFGYKATHGQPFVTARTREVVNGQSVFINAPFRKFEALADAFDCHGQLLATGSAYAGARAAVGYAAYANALTGHYATDPKYGELLIQIIQGSGLERYDVMTTLPPQTQAFAKPPVTPTSHTVEVDL